VKKRLLSILLIALMLFSFTACNGGKETGKTEDSAGKPSDSAKTEDTGADKEKPADTGSDEEVTLSLMVTTRPTTESKDFYLDWLPELVKEKYPNINIEVEQLPTDQYKQTVRLKFASGEGPDFFTWWAGLQAKDLVEAGYVRDLSEFPQLGKFKKEIADSYAFDGKNYAIPLGTSFLTTWYNKDAFAKAGITQLPQNWQEFLDCCEKLKQSGITPITAGDKQSFVIQFGMYQIGASEIYAENPNFDSQLFTGETKFTDPSWVSTVQKFADLYQKGYVIEDSLGLSQEQSRQAFLDGKAAMIFDGSFGYDALAKQGAVEFEKGIFCVPSNDQGKKFVYNLTPSNGIFVNSDDKKQDAIDKVLEYWFTEGTPLFEKWTTTTSDISCYDGVEDSRELIKEYLDRYKNDQSIYNLNNAWPEGVSDMMCTIFQDVISGNSSAEDVCKGMDSKFEELTR